MRRGYRFAVRWIAENDNAGAFDSEEEIAGYVSTLLVGDLFGKTAEQVAHDVKRVRRQIFAREAFADFGQGQPRPAQHGG